MPVLVGVSIDYKGKTFDLTDDEISIGRSDDNVITLNNSSISGRHCLLTRQGATYLLKDQDSTNGTRVNGQPVKEVLLDDRDVVHFGSLEFVYADREPDDLDSDDLKTMVIEPQTEDGAADTRQPDAFSSASPFSKPRKADRKSWFLLITIIGILALACVGLLFYILLFTG